MTSNQSRERKILHVDMDAFFAAVEQLDHPEWRGKPVIVGGTSRRGVVSTASYEARVYGVHSAMPGFKAKKLCPHGIFVRGNMARYKEVSEHVFRILNDVTDIIQPVSIDEAYLDVTGIFHSPEYIGKYIKNRVKKETGLTISVGVSYNKFLAKLASEWNKPDGFFTINRDMVPDILEPLSIGKVHGLGKKSVERLNRIGIFTIGDLLQYRKEDLTLFLGSWGEEIYERIRGIDDRPVKRESERKSIGKETTLREDTKDKEVMKDYLKDFSKSVARVMERKNVEAKTITVKFKTKDFEGHTRSRTLSIPVSRPEEIYDEAVHILEQIEFPKAIRLIGLSMSSLVPLEERQTTLFDTLLGSEDDDK
ncbi:DNA polymerase IV [Fusibacter sp. JL216-2]|uniref:DNA polymerase IV n=1 Tax=Fusibacter sp. JL216-2 TaxID=3071453 RepID=UPI003D32864A